MDITSFDNCTNSRGDNNKPSDIPNLSTVKSADSEINNVNENNADMAENVFLHIDKEVTIIEKVVSDETLSESNQNNLEGGSDIVYQGSVGAPLISALAEVEGGYRVPSDLSSVDSDSDSDTSSDSENNSSACTISVNSDSDDNENKASNNKQNSNNKSQRNVLRTKGELLLEDLPPIEELTISVEEKECVEIGIVSTIVDQLVIVQSYKDMPALDLDSILFLDNGKRTLGRIFDVMGQVSEPFYCVRFNSSDHVKEKGILKEMKVYYAPKTEHTSFVFLTQLMKMKGSDASWEDNNEPPPHCLDYSDDEEERAVRRNIRNASKINKNQVSEDSDEGQPHRKRRLAYEKRMNERNLRITEAMTRKEATILNDANKKSISVQPRWQFEQGQNNANSNIQAVMHHRQLPPPGSTLFNCTRFPPPSHIPPPPTGAIIRPPTFNIPPAQFSVPPPCVSPAQIHFNAPPPVFHHRPTQSQNVFSRPPVFGSLPSMAPSSYPTPPTVYQVAFPSQQGFPSRMATFHPPPPRPERFVPPLNPSPDQYVHSTNNGSSERFMLPQDQRFSFINSSSQHEAIPRSQHHQFPPQQGPPQVHFMRGFGPAVRPTVSPVFMPLYAPPPPRNH